MVLAHCASMTFDKALVMSCLASGLHQKQFQLLSDEIRGCRSVSHPVFKAFGPQWLFLSSNSQKSIKV